MNFPKEGKRATDRGRRAADPPTFRHKCGTSAAQVRHKCGTSSEGSAENSADSVRNGCGTPADVRRGVF